VRKLLFVMLLVFPWVGTASVDLYLVPGGGDPVPEPATMLLFGSGLAILGAARLRRKVR